MTNKTDRKHVTFGRSPRLHDVRRRRRRRPTADGAARASVDRPLRGHRPHMYDTWQSVGRAWGLPPRPQRRGSSFCSVETASASSSAAGGRDGQGQASAKARGVVGNPGRTGRDKGASVPSTWRRPAKAKAGLAHTAAPYPLHRAPRRSFLPAERGEVGGRKYPPRGRGRGGGGPRVSAVRGPPAASY